MKVFRGKGDKRKTTTATIKDFLVKTKTLKREPPK